MEIRFPNDSVCKNSFFFYRRNFFQDRFKLHSEIFNCFEIRTKNFDSHWCSHSRLKHDQARFNRLKFRSRSYPWYFRYFNDFFPNIIWRTNALSRSEEHTSELQSRPHLVCRLLLEKKKKKKKKNTLKKIHKKK